MRCRKCRRVIENNSLYCNWCGAKQIKEDGEISVPKPRRLKSGLYYAQIMIEGKRYSVSGETLEEYYAKARAAKSKVIELKYKPVTYTLSSVLDKYISENETILSPSTIRSYASMAKHRFVNYLDKNVESINWQKMVKDELSLVSEKTLKNAWGLVCAALRSSGLSVPDVNLPSVPKRELGWLDYNQIQILLDCVRGKRVESAVILALHSLRLSELLAVSADDISDNIIHVNKSFVFDQNSALIMKKTNKTRLSTRDLPIVIPRLKEILPDKGMVVAMHPNSIRRAINSACRACGLPEVGVHGLRRSFASLAYHLGWSERSIMAYGGWSNYVTVHNFYIKLSSNDVIEDVSRMTDYYEITDGSKENQ